MKYNFQKSFLFIIPFLISGCDSDAISKVKNTILYSIDKSLNIGDAFKTRSDCDNGKWSENKDSRGRYIVTYTCDIGSNGVSAINKYLLKYPESWASRQIKNDEYLIDSSDKDSLETKHLIDIINKQKNTVDIYINKLYSAFTSDSLISDKLYFSSYLKNMLSIMKLGSRANADRLCHYDNYVDDVYYDSSRSEVDPKYVQESCIKNIYPVFKGFENDVKQNLDASNGLYDFYAGLNGVVGDEYSIDAQKKAIDEYFNKTLLSYEESEQNRIKNISKMRGHIESVQKQLLLVKDEIQVNDVSMMYQWMVSNTGSVDYLGANINYFYNGLKKSISINNDSFIGYAYKDFSNGEIPVVYAEKIFDNLRYDIGDKEKLLNQ